MADVTWRVVFRRVAVGFHVGLGKEGAGLLLGGDMIEATVFDKDGNERCSVTYNISRETSIHLGVNFAGAEAKFQHDENDECPFQQGDWLRFRSFCFFVDWIRVEFTHKGSRARAETSNDVGLSFALGATAIDATAESATTDDDQVVIFGPGQPPP